MRAVVHTGDERACRLEVQGAEIFIGELIQMSDFKGRRFQCRILLDRRAADRQT